MHRELRAPRESVERADRLLSPIGPIGYPNGGNLVQSNLFGARH
jgi:hypothetical protein